MSDDFEFDDDNDDVLLNAICTPPNSSITSPEKRLNEENDENLPTKRPKLNENESPVIEFSQKVENITKRSTPIKRIFPGPAGILSDGNQTDICSQDCSSFFQDGPWEEMSKDFKISMSHLHDKFNIAWIKKEAIAKKFVNQKAPFLAGILQSLEVSEGQAQKSINVTLKDMTGTIQGTIVQNLYEEYASMLILGSVLVLTQFGVLSCTCDNCDNHHFTITPKNLSAIYSGKEKIVIREVDPEDILKDYYQRKKELELAKDFRSLSRENCLSSPIFTNVNIHRHGKGANENTRFQSPCVNRSVLSSNLLNKTVNSVENISLKTGDSNESFPLPKARSIVENTTTNSAHGPSCFQNTRASNSPTTSNKLFTFRKVHTLSDSNNLNELKRNSLSTCTTLTLSDSTSSGTQNTDIKLQDNDNVGDSSKIIEKSQISVRIEKEEREKILKDILQDVDVSSFFDEDFS